MIQEALLSESSGPVVAPPAPRTPTPPRAVTAPLDRKLDALALAGVTPPRGMRRVSASSSSVPASSSPPPLVNAPTDALVSDMQAKTRKIERPVGLPMDALILDAIAAAEATKVMPPQTLPERASSSSSEPPPPPKLVGLPELTPTNQKKPRPVSLADARAAELRRAELPRPPPLPPKGQKVTARSSLPPLPAPPPPLAGAGAPLVPTLATAPTMALVPPPLSEFSLPSLPESAPVSGFSAAPTAPNAPRVRTSAPVPKLMTVLDEVTIPGMSIPSSSGSSSGKTRSSDFYKLQLEFEDTPARPLPALASLVPLPVVQQQNSGELELELDSLDIVSEQHIGDGPLDAPLADPSRLGGVESTDLNRLEELEDIQDLDSLAQALGLKSVLDLSIPSAEGAPVLDDDDDTFEADELPPPRKVPSSLNVSAVRRAAVMAALGEDEGRSLPDERPKLTAAGAAVPVIVRIPSRPKVTAEARARARNLYLSAIEALGKGDRIGAVGHLKLSIHYDESTPLYRDLLQQLERTTKSGEAHRDDDTDHVSTVEGPPALLVMKPSGRMTRPREEWRRAR